MIYVILCHYSSIQTLDWKILDFIYIKTDICTVGRKKKKKHPYLFQYQLSYRDEISTNHHRLLSTLV